MVAVEMGGVALASRKMQTNVDSTPNMAAVTEQRNGSIQGQLGAHMNLLGLLTGAWVRGYL